VGNVERVEGGGGGTAQEIGLRDDPRPKETGMKSHCLLETLPVSIFHSASPQPGRLTAYLVPEIDPTKTSMPTTSAPRFHFKTSSRSSVAYEAKTDLTRFCFESSAETGASLDPSSIPK
jgi:hypothetical protein